MGGNPGPIPVFHATYRAGRRIANALGLNHQREQAALEEGPRSKAVEGAKMRVLGLPPLTEEVIAQAKERKAEAILTLEGFHSSQDISDVIYHVSMSSPSLGVLGWVLKIKIGNGTLEFVREWPYYFDTKEKVKTLGEILAEMERT